MSLYIYNEIGKPNQAEEVLCSGPTSGGADDIPFALGSANAQPNYYKLLTLSRKPDAPQTDPLCLENPAGAPPFFRLDELKIEVEIENGELRAPDAEIEFIVLDTFVTAYDALSALFQADDAPLDKIEFENPPIAFGMRDADNRRLWRAELYQDEGALKLRQQMYREMPYTTDEWGREFHWKLFDVVDTLDGQARYVLRQENNRATRLEYYEASQDGGPAANRLGWGEAALGALRLARLDSTCFILFGDRVAVVELTQDARSIETIVSGFMGGEAFAVRALPEGRLEVFVSTAEGVFRVITDRDSPGVELPADAVPVLGPLPGVRHFTWASDAHDTLLIPIPISEDPDGPDGGVYRWVVPDAGQPGNPPVRVLGPDGIDPITVEVLRGGRIFVGGRLSYGVAEARPVAGPGLALGVGYVAFGDIVDGLVETDAEHLLPNLDGVALGGTLDLIIDHGDAWHAAVAEGGIARLSVSLEPIAGGGRRYVDTPIIDERWDVETRSWVREQLTPEYREIEVGDTRPLYPLKNPNRDWLKPYHGPVIVTSEFVEADTESRQRLVVTFYVDGRGDIATLDTIECELHIDNRRCRVQLDEPLLTSEGNEPAGPGEPAIVVSTDEGVNVPNPADTGLVTDNGCVSGLGVFGDFGQHLVFPVSVSHPSGVGTATLSLHHGRTMIADIDRPLAALPEGTRVQVSLDRALPDCRLGTIKLVVVGAAGEPVTNGWTTLGRDGRDTWERVLMERGVDLSR